MKTVIRNRPSKLSLRKESLRVLAAHELAHAAGGTFGAGILVQGIIIQSGRVGQGGLLDGIIILGGVNG